MLTGESSECRAPPTVLEVSLTAWFDHVSSLRAFFLTLQREDSVPVDHDAQLKDQLWSWFQEGFQKAEHGDVSALKHQTPVEVAPGAAEMPVALSSQVEGVKVPEDKRQR